MANDVKYVQNEVTYSNTSQVLIGQLPPNAKIADIKVLVATAFNDGGPSTIDVGTTASQARYANDVDVSSTGAASVTLTAQAGVVQSTTNPLSITAVYVPAATDPTAGSAKIVVEYAFSE